MKKTYLIPEMLIVRVNTQHLMITSLGLGTDSDGYLDESDILTKRSGSYSVWDDDWNEDE